ncbi:B9 domain-containing protein 2 [Eurytemora carolleeae]|uniref:B9 domain-containing protein 2 n=1 Tax=Eurytemora carolleeae TaxID=1294199 RepID=UPI000C78AA4D|nr:B9 domain-containing protein 2 [Eurytemora carolleeae]XP_023347337.1 B9 domain-containing protein 2 [Eurytemora carolleeae]XP_023347338.1 B9 domain-containing protein 2 [Eurytemora carolleeae]XP_023347340.1 B9 domain-containing protein 2 [Eurytemora carolleeae]|eukprot:XP_023347336.1 B9 domain-containing protein 2-like [Eurytemora affinis]
MAEVHAIGQLVSGSGFHEKALFCRWGIHTGGAWKVLAGTKEGQTQVDDPETGDIAFFSHPIDIHFATRGLQGWPKLWVQVYHQDSFARNELVGYGFTHLPSSPGLHNLQILTWRPAGGYTDTISHHFLGGSHQLKAPELIFSATERHRLTTVATGKIFAQLHIVLRNFEKFGIEC